MQYIEKHALPPTNWDAWFTTATDRRSFDYGADQSTLTQLKEAKKYLLTEQYNLCAYCQQELNEKNSSIEHVLPKEFNRERSTCYTNLVAVCKAPVKDKDKRLHCDKEKGSQTITPFMFLSNSDVSPTANNAYFDVEGDGTILPKPHLSDADRKQVEAFIDVVNLNHSQLKQSRAKDVLDGMLLASLDFRRAERRLFWETQFNAILADKRQPFRQFLLIFIAKMLGIH